MDLWLLFPTAFLVGLTGALVPGPLLTVTVSESLRRGFWAGPLVVAGHSMLEAGIVAGIVLGFSSYFNSAAVRGAAGLLGGFFLLWMGAAMLRDAWRDNFREVPCLEKQGPRFWQGPVISGVLASLSNPYFLLWWATVGAAYIFISLEYGWLGLALFAAGHFFSDLGWYSFISLGIDRGKHSLNPGYFRGLLGFCGMFLLLLAFYFGYAGWRFLS